MQFETGSFYWWKMVLIIVGLFSNIDSSIAQIAGEIKNLEGDPLPYATVLIKGSTKGATANQDGKFNLQVSAGSYTLLVQYIGYEPQYISVEYKGEPLYLSITLEELFYDINEVVIKANQEDPAYRIIREAIARRPYFQNYLKSYSIDVYIKGLFKIDQVSPLFKDSDRMISQMGVDSTGKGILYLSESESKVYFKEPDKTKEIMVSSKVSGDDRGFSFNRFGFLDFYQPEITLNRKIANPIGPNAFVYYAYKHEQSFYDEERRLIHKIHLMPKTQGGPAFSGNIYILDKQWLIHSLDLKLSGKAIQIELMDTLYIRQQFVPADANYWGLFSQLLQFNINILGFKFSGTFNAITQNYELNPDFEKGFFSREIVKIEASSNQKNNEYWESIRPIPLTEEESNDYIIKDSLASYLDSKAYLDSVDRTLNGFKIKNLLNRYNYRNSYAGEIYSGYIATQFFNAVQGLSLGLGLGYERRWRNIPGKLINLDGRAIYGISDQRVRFQLDYRKRFDARYQTYLAVSAGDMLLDFNSSHSIPLIYNSFLMLTRGQSLLRFYNQRFIYVEGGREIGTGQFLSINLSYKSRSLAQNNTDFSFLSGENVYPANDALDRSERTSTDAHQLFGVEAVYTLRLFARYISYPDQRFYRSSGWPLIKFRYKGTFGRTQDDQMHAIDFTLTKENIWRTLLGNLSINFNSGYFFVAPTHFQDYQHFSGNPVLLASQSQYLKGFKLLPLYQFSTSAPFAQVHTEWNDKGFLLRQIPFIRNLGWNTILGYSTLSIYEKKPYHELFVSIDRIGYSVFRILRIDFVWGFSEYQMDNFGIRIAINSQWR
jgi:hypothetical protein